MRTGIAAALLAAALALGGVSRAAPVRQEIVTTPEAGAEASARKGEPVVSTSAMQAVDAIVTQQAYTGGGMTVPAGRLSLWRRYPEGRLFQAFGSLHRDAPPGESNLVVGGIFVPNDLARPPQLYRMDILGPVFYDAPGIAFAETAYRINSLNATRRDLVFTGVADGRAGFLLREFEGDMVRPARTEADSVAVVSGAELQRAGARIRILSASDAEIRYVVLSPLDPVVEAPQVIPEPPPPEEDEHDRDEREPEPMRPSRGMDQSI